MTQDEWFTRYKQRFMDVARVSQLQAQALANAEPFPTLAEGFEDDPEGAADSEMSYWDGD